MSTRTENTNKHFQDALFYGIVTLLGVGLTSVAVYSYRKYQDYKENLDYDEDEVEDEDNEESYLWGPISD